MSSKRLLIQSFVLAFVLSFFTILILLPESQKLLYTNITAGSIEVSSTFLVKIVAVLVGQTGALGSVFYVLAKKIFIK